VTPTPQPEQPSIREIADLTARLQRLSAAGRDADPADRVAFLADKDALIARITTADQADRDGDSGDTADRPEAGR
jgi:predicted RNA-binding Zn ribbon-like protein